jgi:hypothetical protein
VPDFVQFMHPGNEHGSDESGFKRWNIGLHRRKFLRVEGEYVETLQASRVRARWCSGASGNRSRR